MSMLDHLWAGWRRAYIESLGDGSSPSSSPGPESGAVPGAVRPVPDGAGSLFKRILGLDDEEGLIVHRGERCSVLLNAYPYTSGHVLVLPNRAVAMLSELDDDEHDELWRLVRDSVAAIEAAYGCEGVNVGMNLGTAGGAGVPDHLHAHVLPRWAGDTNFMTAIAATRVMPETLDTTWAKLREAWPAR
jgi:ATP adenylyltransferase